MEILDPLLEQPTTSKPLRAPIRRPPSILECLWYAPERFYSYIRTISIARCGHILAVLKSLLPQTALELLAGGFTAGTTSTRIGQLLHEVELVAIVLANDVVPEDGGDAPADQ